MLRKMWVMDSLERWKQENLGPSPLQGEG
jgi:hypothetical protein